MTSSARQASAVVIDSRLTETAAALADVPLRVRLSLDGPIEGFDEMPRSPAGKLYKRTLRDTYLSAP